MKITIAQWAALVALRAWAKAFGLGVKAESPDGAAAPAGPLGTAVPGATGMLGVGTVQGPIGVGIKAAPKTRSIRFLRPSGAVVVNKDWRNVAEKIGTGTFKTANGKALWAAVASLWGHGTTKTFVNHVQVSGFGSGYARVRYEGKTIAVLPWDRDLVVNVPAGVSPFVTLDGIVNSGDWVWAGEDVWYHFYRGAVRLDSTIDLPLPVDISEFRPCVCLSLGNVSWALEEWQRTILHNLYKIVGQSGIGTVLLKAQEFFAGFDPDRGLGRTTANRLAELDLKQA